MATYKFWVQKDDGTKVEVTQEADSRKAAFDALVAGDYEEKDLTPSFPAQWTA
tara:strand:- start:315 stop:473 length:159 start_codon:yes stop_codon:yes gene_type:complete